MYNMMTDERLSGREKMLISELFISRATVRDYVDAVKYAKEFVRTQTLLTAEEAAAFIAVAHKKQFEQVFHDMEGGRHEEIPDMVKAREKLAMQMR